MRALSTHLHFVLRTLRRAPAFTAISVLCLAVGIGAITTMVEVVDLLLFRPPPQVRAAKELVELHFNFLIRGQKPTMTSTISRGVRYHDYTTLRDSLPHLAAFAGFHSTELSLGRGIAARPVTTAFVTGSYFPVLGVQPAVGRLIATDGGGSGPLPAVISYGVWHSRFAGDPSVLGRRITVGKSTYTVAGVAPEGFRGTRLIEPIDVWIPIAAAEQELFDGDHQAFVGMSDGLVQVLARLSPGVSPKLLTVKAPSILQESYVAMFGPRFQETRTVATLEPVVPGLRGDHSSDVSVALWLTGVAAIVLLIACANVAGLLLVRATDRQREVAIRLALGATRTQLAQLFLIEGIVLASVGSVIGLALRYSGGSVIRVYLLPQLHLLHGALDLRILSISAIVTVATGLLCGLAPALHARRRDIAGAVIGAPRSGRVRQLHARRALLVGQVALAMALVAGAALFIASWKHVRDIQLGFEPEHLLVGRMPLQSMGYSAGESRTIYERILGEVRALPGVRDASLSSAAPFVSLWHGAMKIPGVETSEIRKVFRGTPGPELNSISPTFFTTSGTKLVHGRAFTDADVTGGEAVVIINEKLANTFWPTGHAIGNCFQIIEFGPKRSEPPCSRIVGVVADTKSEGIREEPSLQIYSPLVQHTDVAPAELLVRTEGSPEALVSPIRRVMQGAAAGLPFADVQPMAKYLEPEMRPWRLGASMFTLFGAVALGLAGVGLYGVFSYAVSRRTREMGIRTSLGARYADIIRLVMLDGIVLAAAGTVIGVCFVLAIGRVLGALLVGVSGTSPQLLGSAAALVLGVTLLAVALPARRAASVDPAVALREE